MLSTNFQPPNSGCCSRNINRPAKFLLMGIARRSFQPAGRSSSPTRSKMCSQNSRTAENDYRTQLARFLNSFGLPWRPAAKVIPEAESESNPKNQTLEVGATPVDPRIMAVWEAEEFIRAFIDDNWTNHAVSISIECDIPIDELRSIGLLPEAEGSQACRRLIRVPVIHEEVSADLWKKLSQAAEESSQTSVTSRQLSEQESHGEKRKRNIQKTKQQMRHRRQKSTTSGTCAFCHNSCIPSNSTKKTKFFSRTAKKTPEEHGFWQHPTPPPKAPRPSRSLS